jgi:hypothetical protein
LRHPFDRRIYKVERFFIDTGGDFSADAKRLPTFFNNYCPVCLLERFDDRVEIQRAQRAQVDDFDFNPGLFGKLLGGFGRNFEHLAVGDDGNV